MSNPAITSLINSGTNLYLDSIDPDLVKLNLEWGAVGATSNPIIISGLIESGRFDSQLAELLKSGKDDSEIAWELTDQLVRQAQQAFHSVWEKTRGDAGWVSFELDPLIEDLDANMPHADRVERYIELGKKWSAGHDNRMIKVPATPAGLDSLSALSAAGITLNVTLVFTMDQYVQARNNVWEGAQKRASLDTFKSVYSIFVSRVDQYTAQHVAQLSADAQGQVGIVNAKRIWQANQDFWKANPTPLKQEMIFASTGTKNPTDPPTKYVEALAGSDIQTNPPATNAAVAESSVVFSRQVDQLPPASVLNDIDAHVNMSHLEKTLMGEGIAKFAAPQKQLLATIASKRAKLAVG
ncbi:transaldolase family protein [Aureliella helgolandensis]|uniref:Transaldolase n=1 Tax=Aureliella helgolandensis TaxID=2527968 RepID=A0A518GER4_9BACT|nr:transaldolase family protein [Aureliella helgolandensis]QDV27083.1 Transaldolase [Aureliella helgolandensis]